MDQQSDKFPLGRGRMVIGDWFFLKKGDPVEVKVLSGNISSDWISAILLIEQEGKEYRMVQTPEGERPVLPVFKTEEISQDDIQNLGVNEGQATIKGPVFGVRAVIFWFRLWSACSLPMTAIIRETISRLPSGRWRFTAIA
jgi:hypothetical protein